MAGEDGRIDFYTNARTELVPEIRGAFQEVAADLNGFAASVNKSPLEAVSERVQSDIQRMVSAAQRGNQELKAAFEQSARIAAESGQPFQAPGNGGTFGQQSQTQVAALTQDLSAYLGDVQQTLGQTFPEIAALGRTFATEAVGEVQRGYQSMRDGLAQFAKQLELPPSLIAGRAQIGNTVQAFERRVQEIEQRAAAGANAAAGGAATRPPIINPTGAEYDAGRLVSGDATGIAGAVENDIRALNAEGEQAKQTTASSRQLQDAQDRMRISLEAAAKQYAAGSPDALGQNILALPNLITQRPGESDEEHRARQRLEQFFQKQAAAFTGSGEDRVQTDDPHYLQLTDPDVQQVLARRLDTPNRNNTAAYRQQSERDLGNQLATQNASGLAEQLGNTEVFRLLDGVIVRRTQTGAKLIDTEVQQQRYLQAFNEQTANATTVRRAAAEKEATATNNFRDQQNEQALGQRLAQGVVSGTAARIGESNTYHLDDGTFVRRTQAGAVEIREVNALAEAERRLIAQLEREAQRPTTFGQGFLDSLTSRGRGGTNGANSNNIGSALVNFGETAGQLVRYGAAAATIGLVSHALADTKKETLDYIDSLTALQVRLDDTGGNLVGLTNHLEEFSRIAGSNVGETMDAASKSIAAFGDTLHGSSKELQDIGAAGVETASQLAVISGVSLPQATGDLVAIASSFGLQPAQFSQVTDAIANAKRLGGDSNDIETGLASFAGVAQQAGFDPQQAANLISLVSARTNQTGPTTSTQLARLVGIIQGTGGQNTLREAGVDVDATAGNVPQQLEDLAGKLPNLPQAQQDQIFHDLGGVNNLKALTPILKDNAALQEAYARALEHSGAGSSEFNRLQNDLSKLLQRISGDITNIQTNLVRTGVFDGIGVALGLLEPGLRTLSDLLGVMDRISDAIPGFRPLVGVLIDAALALRVIEGLKVRGLVNVVGNTFNALTGRGKAAKAAAEAAADGGAVAAGAANAEVTGAQAAASTGAAAASGTDTAATNANTAATAENTAAKFVNGEVESARLQVFGATERAQAAAVVAQERLALATTTSTNTSVRLAAAQEEATASLIQVQGALNAYTNAAIRAAAAEEVLGAGSLEATAAREREAASLALLNTVAAENAVVQARLLTVQEANAVTSGQQAAANATLAAAINEVSVANAAAARLHLANVEAQHLALGADAERIVELDEYAAALGVADLAEQRRVFAVRNTVEADTVAGAAARNRAAALVLETEALNASTLANERNAIAEAESGAAAGAGGFLRGAGGAIAGAGRGILGAGRTGIASLGAVLGPLGGPVALLIGSVIALDAGFHALNDALNKSAKAEKDLHINQQDAFQASGPKTAQELRDSANALRSTSGELKVETPKAGFLGLGYINPFSGIVDRFYQDKAKEVVGALPGLGGIRSDNDLSKSAADAAKVLDARAKEVEDAAGKAASNGGAAVFANPASVDSLTEGLKKLSDAGASASTIIRTLISALGNVKYPEGTEGLVTPFAGQKIGSGVADQAVTDVQQSLSDYIHTDKGKSAKDAETASKAYTDSLGPISDPKKRAEFTKKVQDTIAQYIKDAGVEGGGQLSGAQLDDLANKLADLYVDPKQSKKGQDAVREGMRKRFREALSKGTGPGALIAQGDQTASDFVQKTIVAQSTVDEQQTQTLTSDPVKAAQARLADVQSAVNLALDKGTKVTEETQIALKAAQDNLAAKVLARAASYDALAKSELSQDQVLGRDDIDLQTAQRELADAMSRGDIEGQNAAQAKINDLQQSRARSVVDAQNAQNSSTVAPGDAVQKGIVDLQNAVNTLNHTTQFDTDGTQTKAYSDALAAVNAAYRAGVDAKVAQANAIIAANRDPRDTVGQAADALTAAYNVLVSLPTNGADGKETAEHAQARAAYNAAYRGSINAQINEINADRDAQVAVGDTIGELRASYYDQLLIAANNIGSVKDAAIRKAGEISVQINRAVNKLYNTQLRALIDPRDDIALAQNTLQTDIFDRNSLAPDDAQGIADADIKIREDKLNIARLNVAKDNSQRTAGTDTRSQLETARTNLANATESLNAELPGTTAYYQQLDNLHKAQEALAAANREAASVSRKLKIDLTDPVAAAQEELRKAQDKLNDDKASGAAPDVINSDQLAVIQGQTSLEAAQFSKNLNAVQTADQLGRITHRAYLDYLQNEHNRLTAITNRTYQQQQELDQIDKAIKEANNSLQGQFNLGDIKVPTVYEVRRSVAQDAIGAASTTSNSNVNTTNSVVINGADLVQVKQFLTSLLGADATSRRPVAAGRKV